MKCLLLLAMLVAVVAAQETENEFSKSWAEFKEKYGKTYTSSMQETKRKAEFKKSLDRIKEHNAQYEKGEVSYRMGINNLADLSVAELAAGLLVDSDTAAGSKASDGSTAPAGNFFHLPEDTDVPDSVDWRLRGAVTPIKDQKSCGCCWAFSATGGMEGQHFLQTGKLVSFSEQQLVDCDYNDFGCSGGFMNRAFEYLKDNPSVFTEDSYPYLVTEFACQNKSARVGAVLRDYVVIPEGDEKQLQLALATIGPICVPLLVTTEFQLYSGGVFDSETCGHGEDLNHAVTLVGYGTHWTGQEVWLLKNQWGTNWGMRGYMLLARNRNNLCGIASVASYPVLAV